MKVRLTYQSGQQYTERLSNFDVKITRERTRVRVSFREKGSTWGYSSWSLSPDKSQVLAHAILTACAGDVKPIEFSVEEPPAKNDIAA